MAQANISLASLAAETADDLIAAKAADDKAASCREAANKKIAQLHKAKASVGRKGNCAIATAFYDALIAGGLSKGTAANYLTVFRDAVKSGKPVTDWNPNRDGKGKGKGKGGKGKGTATLNDLLIKAFNMGVEAVLVSVIASNVFGYIIAPIQYYQIFHKKSSARIWHS